ncbi:hypothetical protein ASC97_04275 [Rhizobium sp. Root1203]|uniref:phage tail tube protein n=1 Tax=Rhizobium sp. Root1203 TaxID=1736427 RepID=UPI00070CE50F|nr:phage tail tube protein [Rhizobium sp. Root1203]KQV27600.1 hypothetical protein ASC97_04275 [Rhizobium sp. Root1203]
MSGKDFGGRMNVRLSTGGTLSLRGTFNVMAGRMSVEATTNQDGSTDRVMTPTAPRATVNFKDGGIDLAALIEAPRQNIVINEENTGVTHHYIDAFFSGESENNRLNGEVSGLTITADAYRRTGG